MRHNLLVYSDPEEPLTRMLLGSGGNELTAISISEILNDVEIYDVIENGKARLSWKMKNGLCLTNDVDTYLINRAFSLPNSLFDEFRQEDRDYAYQEFWAYLSFALSSFPERTSTPGHLGLTNGTIPLPLQWQRVKASSLGVATPRYFYGPRRFLPKELATTDVVRGTVYSGHKWSRLGESELVDLMNEPADQRIFLYQRPQGTPIRASLCGDQILLTDLASDSEIEDEKLGLLAKRIASEFGHRIGELLLFKHLDGLTFGSFRDRVSASSIERPTFRSRALNELLNRNHPKVSA